MKIILLGANGQTAQLLIPLLIENGHSVTGVVRNSNQFPRLQKQGVTPELLDLAEANVDDFCRIFDGADCIIWTAGGTGGSSSISIDLEAAVNAYRAASTVKASRFIIISTMGAGLRFVPIMGSYLRAKGDADSKIMEIDECSWTILRPGWLSNRTPTGKISIRRPGFFANRPIPRGDVAATISELVNRQDLGHRKIFGMIGGSTPIADSLTSI